MDGKTKKNKTVVVGMSGGVDSSVAALLLKQQGYQVIGLFMKNWEEEGPCPAVEDYEDVVSVCEHIGIPFYSVNFSQEYWDLVFSICLKEYEAGFTPNPDILCNREIKFKIFLKKALEIGADYLATGHYCRKVKHEKEWALARGKDSNKDQSYFLYTIKSKILEKVLFPLGEMCKNEVRALAEKNNLPTAQKKDSTGICFIGKRNFKEFIGRYLSNHRGNFETIDHQVVGSHDGIAFYTIGQRKGLRIGGPGEAWYVVGKDVKRNVVIVAQGDHHPHLFQQALLASEVSWVGSPPAFPYSCSAKIRYRSEDAACTLVTETKGLLRVVFNTPQKAITPRQSIVFYQDEICLGGAMIQAPAAVRSSCSSKTN